MLNGLIRDSFFLLFGTVFSKGLVFLAWIFIAQSITVQEYGEIGYVRSTFNMLFSFVNIGIGLYAAREISRINDDDKKLARKVIFILSITSSIVLIELFVVYLYYLTDTNDIETYVLYNLAILPFALFCAVINGIISGLSKFKELCVINTIHGFLSFGVLIFSAITKDKELIIHSFYMTHVIYFTLLSFYLLVKLNIRKCDFKNIKWVKEVENCFKFCMPGFLAGLIYFPVKWLAEHNLMSTDNGEYYLGIFYAAQIFNTLLLMVSYNISMPVFTRISSGIKGKKISLINMHMNWQVGVIIAIPFLIYPKLALILFGEQYKGDDFTINFLCTILYSILFMFKQGTGRKIASDNKMWLFFVDNLVFSVFFVGIFYFIPLNQYSLVLSHIISVSISSFFIVYIYKDNVGLTLKEQFPLEFFLIISSFIIIISNELIHFSANYKIILLIIMIASLITSLKRCLR